MTCAPDFLIVPRHVARNPVARAIANQKMRSAVADYSTRLLLLRDGEDAESDAIASRAVIVTALLVLQDYGHGESGEAASLVRALDAIDALEQRGHRWQTADGPVLELAIDIASQTMQQAGAERIRKAWLRVQCGNGAA